VGPLRRIGEIHLCVCLAAVAVTPLESAPTTLIVGILNAALNWRSISQVFEATPLSTWMGVNVVTGVVGSGLLLYALYLRFES
jgi:hypothetical protein